MLDAIPLDALTDDVAILGKKGAGKTFTARGEVERLMDAGRRACIIDPTGVWWGLRLQPDGETPSAYQAVIFGGDHGDVPLEGASGAKLADLVAGADFSAIVDTKRLSVGERTRLFTDFAERLASVNRRPIHLVIDEAHLFAPQGRVNDPQSGRMVHATNNLVSGGRALGVRIMLITQRAAKLHKDSLSGVETLVAMRMVAPQDRAAVEDWIREQADDRARAREILGSLPSLRTGQGWIWSPQLGVLERARFRPIRTFDSSATPEGDAAIASPVRLASLDLALLQAALLPDAPDARMTAKLGRGAAPPVDEHVIVAAERRGYRTGYRAGWSAAGVEAQKALESLFAAEAVVVISASVEGSAAPASHVPSEPEPPGPHASRSPPGAGPARLLEAMRRAPRRWMTWPEAAVLAVMSPVSGAFHAAKKALVQSDAVNLQTGACWGAADWVVGRPPLVAEEIVGAWQAKLGGVAARILGELLASGAGETKEAVAARLGVSAVSGAYHGGWKKLRTNQLVEPAPAGGFRLAAILRELPRAYQLAS